jgi:PAS domain S-box-containing protein
MELLRNASIKRKLLWSTLVTCGAALAIALSALFWFQSVHFRTNFASQLQTLATIVAQNSVGPLAQNDKKSAAEVLSALQINPQITSASLFDSEGKLFAEYGSSVNGPAGSGPAELDRVTFDDDYAHLSQTVPLLDAKQGRLQVHARFENRALVSLYTVVMVVVLAASLIAILLLSSMMHRIITRPIMALATIARNVTEKQDYQTRASETAPDELGLLTRSFNQMLDQIQSRDQRLQDSQQRFEVAVMGSSDGLWDWNLVTNEVYFSPRWKTMLGFTDEEIPNSFAVFRQLVHRDDVESVVARQEEYLKRFEGAYEAEFRMQHKDGNFRWILSRGAALRDESGMAVRFAGSHTDITERKQNEEEIVGARAKFESLVNSVHGIVWEADARTFAMNFVSNQSEVMLGYPARLWLEDARFRNKILHPADRVTTIEAGRKGVAEGKAYQLEFRVVAADGRVVWLRESVAVETEDGEPSRLRGIAIDITEQKQASEKLQQIQRELVEASRLAGMAEIATGVLHNVGNVLNCVNISSGVIADHLRKSKTDRLAKAAKLVNENNHRLGEFFTVDPKGKMIPGFLETLSDELLREQAKLASETASLQQNVDHIKQIVAMQQSYAKVSGALENVALSELMEDALRMASVALARHRIEVVRKFEPVPPVLVDRHVVLQILINLVNNARDALDSRDGERLITLRICHGEGTRVRVEVTDNGEGIPKQNLARIFNHGFTTKKTGHGFGLHSGANAAKQLGGALNVHSEGPGTGATFILELPVTHHPTQGTNPTSDRHLSHAA